MTNPVRLLLIMLMSSFMIAPLHAVLPSELLKDPELEERARALSAGLRCLVCQNQSIDDSNADLARDLRVLVRERLVAGDTDDEVIDFVVGRYGEFVLLKPKFGAHTLLLWGLAPGLLIGAIIWMAMRARGGNSHKRAAEPLTREEEEALTRLLDKSERF